MPDSPATRLPVARALHGLLALAPAAGIALEVSRALTEGAGAAGTLTERLVRLFSYFTIQSNVLVLVASVLLATRPARTGRVTAVLHLDALLCIGVTGVVYHAVLADQAATLTASGALADLLLHTVSPIGAWVVWLLVGPRPRFGGSTVAWSVAFPLAWIAYTFTRGAVTGWYPYPFLDVGVIGPARAVLNTVVVAVGFLTLALLVRLLERVLPPAPGTGAVPAVDAAG